MHSVKRADYESSLTEAKLLERSKKVRLYQAARDRLFVKQRRGEFDEETLDLTGKMLEKNADIYTFWNMRRRALLSLISSHPKDGDSVEPPESTVKVDSVPELTGQPLDATEQVDKCTEPPGDREVLERTMDSFVGTELRLTETCLEENPKSYSAWYHRMWCLNQCNQPNWNKEISLCNKALLLDERNFHCWDYRRFVIEKSDVESSKEVEFSDKKLAENFSNYSAWHYRASLLKQLYPPTAGADDPQGILCSDRLISELDLAKNALFTDPEDQSAWIYAIWLCANKPFQDENEIDGLTILNKRISVAFAGARNRPGASPEPCKGSGLPADDKVFVSSTKSAKNEIDGVWNTVGESSRSKVWIFQPSEECVSKLDQIEMVHIGSTTITLNKNGTFTKSDSFHGEDSSTKSGVLLAWQQLLECCQQLAEMEPENRWPLLVATVCVQRLETAKNRHDNILKYLDKLCHLNPAREMFYRDLISRQIVHLALEESSNPSKLQLCNLQRQLTSLDSIPIFRLISLTEINVSGNDLTSLEPLKFAVNLRRLTSNENRIEKFDFTSGLKFLVFVSVAMNGIQTAAYFIPLQKSGAKLTSLVVCENHELCGNETEVGALIEMFPSCRVIPYWL